MSDERQPKRPPLPRSEVFESCPHCGQDNYSYFWDEDVVHERLDRKLTKAYHTVQEAIKEKSVHPRLAAMVVGVARVAEACKLRGWV